MLESNFILKHLLSKYPMISNIKEMYNVGDIFINCNFEISNLKEIFENKFDIDSTNIMDVISCFDNFVFNLPIEGKIFDEITQQYSDFGRVGSIIDDEYIKSLCYPTIVNFYVIYLDKFILTKKFGFLRDIKNFFYSFAIFNDDTYFLNNIDKTEFTQIFYNILPVTFDNTGDIKYINKYDLLKILKDFFLTDETIYFMNDDVTVLYKYNHINLPLDYYFQPNLDATDIFDINSIYIISKNIQKFAYINDIYYQAQKSKFNLNDFTIFHNYGKLLYGLLRFEFQFPDEIINNVLKLLMLKISKKFFIDLKEIVELLIDENLNLTYNDNIYFIKMAEIENVLLEYFNQDFTILFSDISSDFTYIYVYNYSFTKTELYNFLNSLMTFLILNIIDFDVIGNLNKNAVFNIVNFDKILPDLSYLYFLFIKTSYFY